MQRRLKNSPQNQKSVRHILGKRRKQNNSVYYINTINQEIIDIFKLSCKKKKSVNPSWKWWTKSNF